MKRKIENWLEDAFSVAEGLFKAVGQIALFLTGLGHFLGLLFAALILVSAVAFGAYKLLSGEGSAFGIALIYIGASFCAVSFALHKRAASLDRASWEGKSKGASLGYYVVRDLSGVLGGVVLLSGFAVIGLF